MKKHLFMTFSVLALALAATPFNCVEEINAENVGPTPIEFVNNNKGQYLGKVDEGEDLSSIPETLTIHYQMDPPVDYSNKEFYLWVDGVDGESFEYDGIDDFGMHITVNPRDYGYHSAFKFIIKNKTTWAGQSTDTEIPYATFKPVNNKVEVWCIDGDPGVINVYDDIKATQGGKIKYNRFEDWTKIKIKATAPMAEYRLFAFNQSYYLLNPTMQNKKHDEYLIDSGKINGSKTHVIDFGRHVPASLSYKVEIKFVDGKVKRSFASFENLYTSPRFEKFYTYDGNDLGATYTKDKTSFKLWAPTCANVELRVYKSGTPRSVSPRHGSDAYQYYLMNYTKGGVWSCEVDGDLDGMYYTYYVQNSNGSSEVVDPYAKSAGINGKRGMILDFDKTNPEGWNEVPDVWDGKEGFDIKSPTDLSVYEIHIRDLTMDDTWGGNSKQGTYQAFMEKGTTYTQAGKTVKTGHDHINELGVNAIQIMPFFDQDNVEHDPNPDNNKIDQNYNWGYNPQNYNVVEGLYSSDPYHGEVRVKELKELIKSYALDENHTRVIMDVVYNHVSSVSTVNFNKIMPKYYFRITPDGYYADGAGCGNEVKTEATMMRKFIVDSVKWWASEYKIKGFRFDLMGLIDTKTMRLVKDAVYDIDPDNVCWGEGWALGYNGEPNTLGTDTYQIYSRLSRLEGSEGVLAGFNDSFRNSVRGGNDMGWGNPDSHPTPGYIAKDGSNIGGDSYNIANGMIGMHPGKGHTPYQTVNYASCHDNWTLYDQLHWTLSPDKGVTEPDYYVLSSAMLGVQSSVTFGAGISFYHAGEELMRTKIDNTVVKEGEIDYTEDMYGQKVSHNSYKSSDETNSLKYDRKIAISYNGSTVSNESYFNKYCEMIKSRKNVDVRLNEVDNVDNTKANVWYNNGTADGSTAFGVYVNNGGCNYHLFFAANADAIIDFGGFENNEIIFNSLGDGSYGLSYNTGKLSLSARQFVVFKEAI